MSRALLTQTRFWASTTILKDETSPLTCTIRPSFTRPAGKYSNRSFTASAIQTSPFGAMPTPWEYKIAVAHRYLKSNEHFGKMVVTI